MLTALRAATWLAPAFVAVMLTDLRATEWLAPDFLAVVLTDLRAAAWFVKPFDTVVGTFRAPSSQRLLLLLVSPLPPHRPRTPLRLPTPPRGSHI